MKNKETDLVKIKLTQDSVSQFIHNNIGQEFPVNHPILSALISAHPEKEDKLAQGIIGFKIVPNKLRPQYGECCIIKSDGSLEAFSFKKCLKKKSSTRESQFVGAMRDAIFAQSAKAKKDQTCQICQSKSDLEADHITPFAELLDRFVTENQVDISKVEVYEGFGSVKKLRDVHLKKKWEIYHAMNATYQTLCKPCHLKKTHNKLEPQL